MTLCERLFTAYDTELSYAYFCMSDAYDDLCRIVEMAYEVVDAELDRLEFEEGDMAGFDEALVYRHALEDFERRLSRREGELTLQKTNPDIVNYCEEIARLLAFHLVPDYDWVFEEIVKLAVEKQ